LAVAALTLAFAALETGGYVALRLTPQSYEPFRDLAWMRGAFHPLFTVRGQETYVFWPYVGNFFRPTWRTAPAGLPRPFPEAYVYQDLWGQLTPLAKPKGELRVFVLGGSTMMGQGATWAAATVPSRLEYWLRRRQPPGSPWTIRVVNAGVGGYTSTQEQVLITTRLLAYAPDAFLVCDGYNDFMELWSAPNLPPFWGSYSKHLYEGFNRMQSLRGLLGQLGFLASTRLYCLALPRVLLREQRRRQDGGGAAPGAALRDSALAHMERAVWVYTLNMRSMVGVSGGHHIPLIMALQPTLAYGKPPSERERGLLAAHEAAGNAGWLPAIVSYYGRMRAAYREAAREFPGRVLDESELFKAERATLYGDHCHYNDAGNDKFARRLAAPVYAALKQRVGKGL